MAYHCPAGWPPSRTARSESGRAPARASYPIAGAALRKFSQTAHAASSNACRVLRRASSNACWVLRRASSNAWRVSRRVKICMTKVATKATELTTPAMIAAVTSGFITNRLPQRQESCTATGDDSPRSEGSGTRSRPRGQGLGDRPAAGLDPPFALPSGPPLTVKGASHLLTQTAPQTGAAPDSEPPAAHRGGLNGGGQATTAA